MIGEDNYIITLLYIMIRIFRGCNMKKIEKDEIIDDSLKESDIKVKKPRSKETKIIHNNFTNEPINIDDEIITRNYDFNLLEVVIIVLITGIVVSIGLAIHNIPEGLAIGSGFENSLKLGYSLAIAIAIHDIPEGCVLIRR